ncbi:MAG: hypothetical protein JWQ93_2205 [Marmoricola sp.]|jgi:hypothetical protein|nr:hypothetical protein [Marmoricola sp.]MCW2836081.1 hypothetical protein [Marmoricola sp.]
MSLFMDVHAPRGGCLVDALTPPRRTGCNQEAHGLVGVEMHHVAGHA